MEEDAHCFKVCMRFAATQERRVRRRESTRRAMDRDEGREDIVVVLRGC